MREKPFYRRNSWFSFSKKEERNTWLANFVRMNELKDQVCSSWFAPVGSASDYPFLSKWVIYGEVLFLAIYVIKIPLYFAIDGGSYAVVCICFLCVFFHFQLACNGSCPGTSDEISPIYSLWATLIGLYMANYVVERSSG